MNFAGSSKKRKSAYEADRKQHNFLRSNIQLGETWKVKCYHL